MLDSDTVLFDRRDRRVFVVNETASVVWEALAQGLDCTEIAAELSQRTGVENERILDDCRSLVVQWKAAGLGNDARGDGLVAFPDLDPGSDAAAEREPRADEPASTNLWYAVQRQADERRRYRIADLRLNLDAPATAFGLIDGLLDHLKPPAAIWTGADANASATVNGPTSGDEPVTLTIGRIDIGWALYLENTLLSRCDDDSKLAPMLHATVLHLTYAASQSRLLIHGAAAFSGDRCVLLPGQPGAGKSTLTAALVASGLGYCTDDCSMLDGSPLRLRGIPLCIGLKEGSWPLLETTMPEVGQIPTHIREDGQRVRYLSPRTATVARPNDSFRVAAIVFPSLVEGASCRLDPMSRSAALLKIATAGYHLTGELDSSTFEAMIEWLGTLE